LQWIGLGDRDTMEGSRSIVTDTGGGQWQMTQHHKRKQSANSARPDNNRSDQSAAAKRPKDPDVMNIFRVGTTITLIFGMIEGVGGPLINAHFPALIPIGGSPLAEFGIVMGVAYCVAEVARGRKKKP
jgi:hypothetical protein